MQARCNSAKVSPCIGWISASAGSAVVSADTAQRMIDDHSKARKELMDIAKDMKIGVAAGLSKEHRELLLRLTKNDGADFDRDQGVAKGRDADVKAITGFKALDQILAQIKAQPNIA